MNKKILLSILVITVLTLSTAVAWADENTGDSATSISSDVDFVPPPPLEPIKWQQRPDMEQGFNVISLVDDNPEVMRVADDWLCLDGSPVTDLHFWGSYPDWYPNNIPDNPHAPPGVEKFRIQIFSDAPAVGFGSGEFSRPDKLLYEVWVDDFTETFVASIPLSWPGQEFEHKYRYDLDLPEKFKQVRGTIYWLSIAAVPIDCRYPWGWESSMDRWNDFAVEGWYKDTENSYWMMIMHPQTEQYIDMSFELTTDEGSIKWLQFPDMADGRNIVSLPNNPVVADDWLCTDGMPITEVHFWGSYLSWGEEVHWEQGNPGPPNLPEPPGVVEFKLSFHEDIPAGVDPYMPWSHPGRLIRDVWVDYTTVNEQYWDSVPHTNPDGTTWWEHKFYYIICLDEPFKQEKGTVYWLDIGAKPRDDWFWGWETSKDHWNDNAVRGWEDDFWWKPIEPYTTEQVDMAFLLTTGKDICGDVDGNGIINILDARLLMNHIANPGAYPVNPCTGNVDGINGIDMDDLVLLLKHIFDPAGNPLNCPGI